MVIAASMPGLAVRIVYCLAALARSGAGPGIGRGTAQQLARRELARPMYQPSIEARILHWLGQQLARFFELVNVSVPGGWWALICLIAAAILVAAVVLIRIRPAATGRRHSGAIQAGAKLSARDHRELAERSAAEGDCSAAVIELVRAIAAELEERDILPAIPGRTADELAAEAGQALPAHARELTDVARLFDDVMYGGRTGTPAAYQRVRTLDSSLRAGKLTASVQPVPAGAAQ